MKEILRKCQACLELKDRAQMIKITKLPDGTLKVNPSSKELGRSVYVCKNPDCVNIFIKKKKLKTALRYSNMDEILKTEEKIKSLL